ncbi:hypothetical protein HY988_03520 [Candidatus Micrarchaeota archaeon]|nr:hypothetical protein [Candidatus Micrarchaeota archaeon]
MLKTEKGLVRQSPRGLRFDYLLKTENAQGCKFYKTQCDHCNIPDIGRGTPPQENIMGLVRAIASIDVNDLRMIKQADLYCTGNVLDKDEVGNNTFEVATRLFISVFSNLSHIGVDTRPEIALTETGTERLLEIKGHHYVEPIIGYETHNDHLRTSKNGLHKTITREHMEAIFRLVRDCGLGLQVNVMLMPVPTMELREAVEEAINTITYLAKMSERFRRTEPQPVLINLHPLYVTQKMVAKWGEEILRRPLPGDAEIDEVVARCKDILPIFVGRYDEGLGIRKAYTDD